MVPGLPRPGINKSVPRLTPPFVRCGMGDVGNKGNLLRGQGTPMHSCVSLIFPITALPVTPNGGRWFQNNSNFLVPRIAEEGKGDVLVYPANLSSSFLNHKGTPGFYRLLFYVMGDVVS